MQSVLQQNIQEIAFKLSIEREELLIKKYNNYYKEIKDKNLIDMMKEFENTSREHIKIVMYKIEKLNPQGRLKQ
ncbi:MAG TPA: hypothetical protein DEP72_08845 [Clostridiales bacterium]|nr:MAG: hypothetical protein A2Y18_03785 [Clostridiales bacterium GWD2_32_19]HCC08246.1 hypothetical protein [Clostridiales bacterium]